MVIIEPVFDVIAEKPVEGHVTVKVPDLYLDHTSYIILGPGQQTYEIMIQIGEVSRP